MSNRAYVIAFLAFGALIALIVGLDLFVHIMQQPAPAEAGAGASNWDTYLTLLGNVPHWTLEITIEVVTGVLVYPLARWVWSRAIMRHDREVHGHGAHEDALDDPIFRDAVGYALVKWKQRQASTDTPSD